MAESEILDLNRETVDVYYIHGRRDELRARVAEHVLDLERLDKIVNDTDDAIAEYQVREDRPAPNPLRIMIVPDKYIPDNI